MFRIYRFFAVRLTVDRRGRFGRYTRYDLVSQTKATKSNENRKVRYRVESLSERGLGSPLLHREQKKEEVIIYMYDGRDR